MFGTIPMYYRGNRYNIPMSFWIPEMYPQHAPMTFVSPTDNMMIKAKHKHVDTQGRCYSPYLSRVWFDWLFPL
jgi:ESCRT-I complex subunit TSG101